MDNHTPLDKAKEFETMLNLLENNQAPILKSTCLFYVAVHYLHALALQQNKVIGNSHGERKIAINPYRDNPKRVFIFKKHIYDAYMSLKEFSEYERYHIDSSLIVYQKQIKDNYEKSKLHFANFVNYLVNNHNFQK